MSVSNINFADGAGSYQNKSSSADLDKDAFLEMFMTEVQYQDPLNPMSNSEYASQLAQYSQLEQLTNMNTTLNESLEANYILTNSINNSMATSLIGKELKVASNEIDYKMTEGSEKLYFSLNDNATEITVRIYDENGDFVTAIDHSNLDAGNHYLEWDGLTKVGSQAGSGTYTYEVEAFDVAGNQIAAIPFASITVDGIRYKDGQPLLVADGSEYEFGNVMEIWESSFLATDNDDDDDSLVSMLSNYADR